MWEELEEYKGFGVAAGPAQTTPSKHLLNFLDVLRRGLLVVMVCVCVCVCVCTCGFHLCSGQVSPEVVIDLMRKCNPPVGWGKLCPQTVAYKVRGRESEHKVLVGIDMYVYSIHVL